MQTAKAAKNQRAYEDQRNKQLVVRRSEIVNLKQKELQRLAVWLDVPVRNETLATMRDGCRAAWDRDKIFLTERIEVPDPPPNGIRAKSYTSSEAYKSYQSRIVQSGST